VGGRRKARVLALTALYDIEMTQNNCEFILEDIFSQKEYGDEVFTYTNRLVHKTVERMDEIDKVVSNTVENWEMSRIAIIDKNILRLAVCELLYFDDIPVKVTLDEAIEIAKEYSTEDSGRFVNGVLDKIANNIDEIRNNIRHS